MKRERRQELKTNELSVQLQRFGEYIQQRTSTLIAIGIGVILVVVAMAWRSHKVTVTNEEGWAAFYEAPFVERDAPDRIDQLIVRYGDILANYEDPTLVTQARRQLVSFCLDQVPTTKEDAKKTELLGVVEDNARILLEGAGGNLPLKAAALNWLAAVEENRFAIDGDASRMDRARSYLERIRNEPEFTGTAFQADVLARLNEFDSLWEPVVLADPPPPPVPLEGPELPRGPVLTPVEAPKPNPEEAGGGD